MQGTAPVVWRDHVGETACELRRVGCSANDNVGRPALWCRPEDETVATFDAELLHAITTLATRSRRPGQSWAPRPSAGEQECGGAGAQQHATDQCALGHGKTLT